MVRGIRGVRISTRLAVPFLVLVLAAAALVASPAAGGPGAERLPATCVASISDGVLLTVGISTPEFPPYWDVAPPFAAYAHAHGYATFTPSGRLNVSCTDSGSVSEYPYEPAWPSGTFTGSAGCFTARGGAPNGDGAKVYTGRATVTTVGGDHVTIECHAEYAYTYTSP